MRLNEIKATAIRARSRHARRPMAQAEPLGVHAWRGASGRTFLHTVYNLVDCPAPAAASYLLVHRDATGARRVLAVDRTRGPVDSLNLAAIRHRAANLGANEVHLNTGWRSDGERAIAAFDLAAVHGGDPATAFSASGMRH